MTVEKLDHYSVLEVPHGAEPGEVEEAFRTLQTTYARDSLAIYSILDASEAEFVREQIDEAYRVLSDEEQRRLYDRERAEKPSESGPKRQDAGSVPTFPAEETSELRLNETPSASSEAAGEDDAEFDGIGLRRARMRRGMELDQVAEITKISPNYLRCIEDERFDELPAAVYVRGFVAAFARALGMDPEKVASRYIAHLEASRSEPKRSRLLGRT